jgi:hypothetical protein
MRSIALFSTLLALSVLVASAATCPGCPVSVDTKRSDVVAAANFAASTVAANAEVSEVKVLSARVQVVAGVNYFLDFEATYNGVVHVISATVFQDLSQKYSLNAYSVKESRPADTIVLASCAGCLAPADIKDPNVKAAISFLWADVTSQDSTLSAVAASDLTVVSAQTQIVNGVNYYLHVKATVGSTVVDVSGVVYSTPQGSMSVSSLAVAKASA